MADKKQNQQHYEGKQQSLERRFDADFTEIETEIDFWIEQSASKIMEAQEERIEVLRKLIQTKGNIEREILSITEELRAAYSKSRNILKVVLDGKVSDYDEALKQLDELKAVEDKTHVEVSQEL